MGDPIVDKHILDIIARNPSSDVEVSHVKVKAPTNAQAVPQKKATNEAIIVGKTKVRSRNTKKQITKKKKSVKPAAEKHVKELKQKVKQIHSDQRKQVSALKKEFKKGNETIKKHLRDVHKTVEEGKNIYVPEPRPSLENQMLIESMNRLTAVVKQLVVLFNAKMSNEEGPLFAKLDEIAEQNEKIAQGILAVADMVQDTQTKPASIREVNPYRPRVGPGPMMVQPQQPSPQEMQNVMPPPDLGAYQEAGQYQDPNAGQPFMGPVSQNTVPLPPFSPPAREEKPVSPKRMLF
jgi:hypothetical protein